MFWDVICLGGEMEFEGVFKINGLFGWEEDQHEERSVKYQSFSFIQTSSRSLKEGKSSIEVWSFRNKL